MKLNDRKLLLLAIALTISSSVQAPTSAITDAQSGNKLPISNEKKTGTKSLDPAEIKEPAADSEENALLELAKAYQDGPGATTYSSLWQYFLQYTQKEIEKHKDPSHFYKSCKVLLEAGLKIIDPVGANNAVHLYTFNRMGRNDYLAENRYALIQWNEQVRQNLEQTIKTTTRRSKSSIAHFSTITKSQLIEIPNSVELKEAAILPSVISQKSIEKTKPKAGHKLANSIHSKVNKEINSNHYLALLGNDLQGGHTWALGLKQSNAGWVNCPNLFQTIPTFLLLSNSAKFRFSNNALLITMSGSNNDELIMPFVEDHFSLSSKEAQESASAAAHQFLNALQCKRIDLAKVWLADAKLASIPEYLGLLNRPAGSQPLRLINMPQPLCGGSRFRLISGARNDLILDVVKMKNEWLVKALFIAPVSLISGIDNKSVTQ